MFSPAAVVSTCLYLITRSFPFRRCCCDRAKDLVVERIVVITPQCSTVTAAAAVTSDGLLTSFRSVSAQCLPIRRRGITAILCTTVAFYNNRYPATERLNTCCRERVRTGTHLSLLETRRKQIRAHRHVSGMRVNRNGRSGYAKSAANRMENVRRFRRQSQNNVVPVTHGKGYILVRGTARENNTTVVLPYVWDRGVHNAHV
jgi:hypothetical protein